MPDITPRLGLKKPLGNENFNRASYNENLDLMDANVETPAGAQAKVNLAIANLINGAPGALDALNELAAAMGNDPNFATTMTNALAQKLNISAYTAADVLAKLKTVDGAGSGLDAGLFNGKQLATGGTVFDRIPCIGLDGVMEVGSILDFHTANGDADYKARLSLDPNNDAVWNAQKMWHAGMLRDNGGKLELFTGGAWKGVGGVDYFAMTNNVQNYGNAASVTVPFNNFIDLMTVNGKGLLSAFLAAMSYSTGAFASLGFSLVVDGVEMFLHTNVSGVSIHPVFAGDSFYGPSPTAQITQFNGPLKFNSSLTVRLRCNNTANGVVISAQDLAVRLATMMV